MPWAVVGGMVASSLIGSRSSGKAADASKAASDAAVAEQRRQFDEIKKLNQPVVDARDDAISALRDLVGLPSTKSAPVATAPEMVDGLPANLPRYKRNQLLEMGLGDGAPRSRTSGYNTENESSPYLADFRMMAKGGIFGPGEKIIAGEAGPEIINQGGRTTMVNRPTAFQAATSGSVTPIKSNYRIPIDTRKNPVTPRSNYQIPVDTRKNPVQPQPSYRDLLYGSRGDSITTTGADGRATGVTLLSDTLRNDGRVANPDGSGGPNPATYELDPVTGEYRVVENDGGREGGYQFETDPGYNFRLAEGRRALDMGASAAGRALSGAAVKAAFRYNQDVATGEFSNIYNRIANIANFGQVGANTVSQAGYNTGQGVAGSIQAGGAARSSGYLGQGNAIQQAINQGMYVYGMNQPSPYTQPPAVYGGGG